VKSAAEQLLKIDATTRKLAGTTIQGTKIVGSSGGVEGLITTSIARTNVKTNARTTIIDVEGRIATIARNASMADAFAISATSSAIDVSNFGNFDGRSLR